MRQAAHADFVDDSKATLELRNFYGFMNYRHSTTPSIREWGQGAIFRFKSGYTEGPVGFGVNAIGMYGQRLDGSGRDGKPDQSRALNNYGIFPYTHGGRAESAFGKGGLTGKMKIPKTDLHVGALQPYMPIVLTNDGRMLPQIYKGTKLSSREFDHVMLTLGRLDHTKTRASTNDATVHHGCRARFK